MLNVMILSFFMTSDTMQSVITPNVFMLSVSKLSVIIQSVSVLLVILLSILLGMPLSILSWQLSTFTVLTMLCTKIVRFGVHKNLSDKPLWELKGLK